MSDRFAEHVRTDLPNEWVKFAKPGTNINMLCFNTFHGYLVIIGDLGDAVYQWNQAITLEWVAGCNLDYFVGKCQASQVGRNFVQWDTNKVMERLKEWKHHYEEYFGCPFPEDKEEMYYRAESAAAEGEFKWQCFLNDEGYELFDYMEEEYSWGEITHCRAKLHLEALKAMIRK